MRNLYVVLAFHLLFNSIAGADEFERLKKLHNAVPDKYAGQTVMNGVSFTEIGDLQDLSKIWSLVTVRFREDSKEQRFTYANQKAWNSLTSGNTDYPEGAAFLKIGYLTETDLLFPSSIVPSGPKRYQLMIKDKSAKDTDGWKYALFSSRGVTFNGDHVKNAKACAACHSIASSRGYVFSQLMSSKNSTDDKNNFLYKITKPAKVNFKFDKIESAQLPETLSNMLPAPKSFVLILRHPITKNNFEGTFDEILPIIIEKSSVSDVPVAFISDDNRFFSAAYKTKNNGSCPKNKFEIQTIRTIFNKVDSQETLIKINKLCIILKK
jgi:hypothetical protein